MSIEVSRHLTPAVSVGFNLFKYLGLRSYFNLLPFIFPAISYIFLGWSERASRAVNKPPLPQRPESSRMKWQIRFLLEVRLETSPAGKAPALYTGNEWLSKPDMGTPYKLKSTTIKGTILKDKPRPLRKTNLSQFPEKLCRKIPYCPPRMLKQALTTALSI